MCSNKRRQRPQYRLFESIDNGVLGGDWTELKYPGTIVAVNDTGTLLWRVEGGVALSPCKLEPMSPFSTHWLEQANEGQIEAVVLTTSTAWYLTSNGVGRPLNIVDTYCLAVCSNASSGDGYLLSS